MIVADLHIHSRYSRATAKSLDPEHLWLHAQLKGVDLVGAGDCTHALWLDELEEKLEETGDGAFRLKREFASPVAAELPPACSKEVRFVLSGEISSIYKRHGKTRKVHSLILPPDLKAARSINARLERIGNLHSDGRPILGLDAHDLLELCLEVSPETIFIPAHIWTPWFSLFGSKSGFDSIEECFADLTPHIHALETGLSSDPPMNWRLSALDRFHLVSHSDAHSPGKLAREADLFNCEPNFPAIAAALADHQGDGLYGTLEFFPDEGKYHLDGHRKCGVRLTPEATRELGGICPKCGRPMTVGVLSRVADLADRPLGYLPENAKPYESLVPLNEVIAEIVQKGPNTKGVQNAVNKLLCELGPELFILREAPYDELERLGGPLLSEAISRMRKGQVVLEGGYDGEFGVVRIFSEQEREKAAGQKALWAFEEKLQTKVRRARPKKAATAKPRPKKLPAAPKADVSAGVSLNLEQARAASYRGGHLIVRAGPGSGKTRLLVERAVGLLAEGIKPKELLMITFTRKAAGELKQRLAAMERKAARIKVSTFHALGGRSSGRPPVVRLSWLRMNSAPRLSSGWLLSGI
jgi:DNA helicase-2/ATP-dependent DNA helicase PcrA